MPDREHKGRIQIIEAVLGKSARSTGRRPNFDDALEQRMRDQLQSELLKYRGKLPSAKHTAALVRKFAEDAGLVVRAPKERAKSKDGKVSQQTLTLRVTRPVLAKLRGKK
jgi:hypothetical protein